MPISFKYLIYIGISLYLSTLASAQIVGSSGEEAAPETAVEALHVVVSPLPKDELATLNPGNNFYLYANSSWLSDVEIEKDSLSAGALRDAVVRRDAVVARLEFDVLNSEWPRGSDEAKYQAVFSSFANGSRVDRRRLLPLRETLRSIRLARRHHEIAALLGDYRLDAGGLFRVSLRVSQREGRAYVPYLGPADLMLGSSDLYLRQDATAQRIREEGAKLLATLLRRGSRRSRLTARVEAVLQLETNLARHAPGPTQERNPTNVTQYRSMSDLSEAAPAFPWSRYLIAQGLGVDTRVNIAPFESLDAVADVFAQTPVAVWRDYLVLRLLLRYGDYLPEDIALVTHKISELQTGTTRPLPSRYERASRFAQWVMPDVLARRYVEGELPPETVRAVETMAEQMRAVYRRRIASAPWLSTQTRTAALAKLEHLEFMIGVPPQWNTYADYNPDANNLFGNAYQKLQARHQTTLARLREHPVDGARDIRMLRRNIFFSPLQVGAYYLPRLNVIVLPAAYLQPPFFDPQADAAYNYGTLGTTLGHEIGHAFDDQGSKFGPTGALENWWTPQDRSQFDQKAAQLSAQFLGHEAAPGIAVNTDLTLGENLSDLAGIETALAGLQDTLDAGAPLASAERNLTLQRFFLSYAGKRRKLRRPETDAQLAPLDRHSPPDLRTNIILPNIDAWYDAFAVSPTDDLWLPPHQRVSIW